MCVVWLATLGLYWLSPVEINSLTDETLAIVLGTCLSFSLGGWAAYLYYKQLSLGHAPSRAIHKESTATEVVRLSIFALLTMMLPFYLLDFFHTASLAGIGNIFFNVRETYTEVAVSGESTPFIRQLFQPFAGYFFFLHLAVRRDSRRDRLMTIGASALAVLGVLLTTGRTGFVTLGLGYLFIEYARQRKIGLKFFWVSFMLLCVMSVMFFVAKNVAVEHNTSATLALLRDHIFEYVAGPLAAFDKVVHGEGAGYNHTLSSFYRFSNQFLGTAFPLPPVIDEYVFVPFPTNVYTVLKFFYLDFGMWGLFGVMFGIGLIQTYIYYRAVDRDPLYIVFYAVLIYPLIIIFFDDYYGQIIGYAKIYILLLLYFRLLRIIESRGKAKGLKRRICQNGYSEGNAGPGK